MNFPILSSIIFLPLIGAFFVFLTRSEKGELNNGAIYIALENAMGYKPTTQVERSGWNKCVKDLREAGATPDEVTERAEMYKQKFKVE